MTAEWNEARLQTYIDGKVEEGSTLEYKSAPSLGTQNDRTTEITRDVSAFANAAGGVIIYGLREFREEEKKHLAERIDPIDRTQFTKEWLEHVIGTIQRRLIVKIHSVQLSTGTNDVAYVVEIPQSDTAHQATDGKYYQRQNFERPFMRDYQIRDVMRRRQVPVVKVDLRIIIGKHGWRNNVWWRITNESDVFARHVMLSVKVPIRIRNRFIGFEDAVLFDENSLWRVRASNHLKTPLFPRSEISGEFKFKFVRSLQNSKGEELQGNSSTITFCVYADEMPPFEGSVEAESVTTVSEFDTPPDK